MFTSSPAVGNELSAGLLVINPQAETPRLHSDPTEYEVHAEVSITWVVIHVDPSRVVVTFRPA